MARIAARHLVQIIITLWLASTVVFVLIHASGDPTQGFLPAGVSPQVREEMREQLGLNDPIALQYVRFIGRGFIGDFGTSWRDGQPALSIVINRLPATLELAATALVLAVVCGLGYSLAVQRRGPMRTFLHVLPSVGQAVPTFWLGSMLMMLFAVRAGWLPSSGREAPFSVALPALTLALQPASTIARLFATSMDDVTAASYIRTARSKGLPPRAIIFHHLAPNALLPTVSYIGLQAGFIVGGAVVVETLFAWPGIGRLALQSALVRDLPVVHAFVAVTALSVIIVNLIVDLVHVRIDPRLRGSAGMVAARG